MEKSRSLMRSRDVAHILDCSPDDVVELARKGKLKATREGKFWKYHHATVLAYKRKQEKDK